MDDSQRKSQSYSSDLFGSYRGKFSIVQSRKIMRNPEIMRNLLPAAPCIGNLLKLCRPSRKYSTVQKAQIILSCFLQTPTTPGIHGKSERRFRRHFPARDIAKEDLLQRHRDPQSIRSDTSPNRKDKNARASLPQQRAEAAPTGPAPRRQKEQMGKSADGDARVLLRVQRLGDPVQRCQQHRDHDSPCGRLLRGAIPIPLIKTSSAPAPSLSPQRSASTTRRRRDGLELNPRADQRADLRHH